ncbi:hypothetical protein IWX76_002597 [Pedobacter sp. CAN_A7]|uniref:hypothetical protein n=1 Tax=Pedobacter sp. CAN_A7 TaxID=2787722 RepID=UPI0018CB16EB
MFDELEKYNLNGSFFFQATDLLEEVCNAPREQFGIFLVYALRKGRVELIYVGKSGYHITGEKAKQDTFLHDGLRENLVDGIHFDETKRKNCWPVQMLIEDIEALHIHWYVTYDGKYKDRPKTVKMKILKIYENIYGNFPRWNLAADLC